MDVENSKQPVMKERRQNKLLDSPLESMNNVGLKKARRRANFSTC